MAFTLLRDSGFQVEIGCLLESFKNFYPPLKEGSVLKFKILSNINYTYNDLSKILFTFIGHVFIIGSTSFEMIKWN